MEREHYKLKKIRTRGAEGVLGGATKISDGKVGLVIYHWKDLFTTRILVKKFLAYADN